MNLHNFFRTIHSALLQTFCWSNWIWKFKKRLPFRQYLTHQCIKQLQRKSSCFLTEIFKCCQNSTFWKLIFTLPSWTLLKLWVLSVQKNTITAKAVSQLRVPKELKVENYLANEKSGLAIFSTDQRHIFGSNVGSGFEVILRGKGPPKPGFAYDIVRMHALMIYTDLIEYIIIGDMKTLQPRCFLSRSQLKDGDNITTVEYMNYQTFSSRNSDHRSRIFFSIHIDLRDRAKKYPLHLSVSFVLFWCLQKSPTFISNVKDLTKWLLQDKWRFHSIEVLVDNLGGDLVHLHKLQMSLVVENFSRQLQRVCETNSEKTNG